jgi:hypothetical protein
MGTRRATAAYMIKPSQSQAVGCRENPASSNCCVQEGLARSHLHENCHNSASVQGAPEKSHGTRIRGQEDAVRDSKCDLMLMTTGRSSSNTRVVCGSGKQ